MRRLLIGVVALSAVAVPARAQAVGPCDGVVGFASPTEAAYVNGVVKTTWGVTCLEARNVFRNRPWVRDQAPHHVSYEGTAFEPSDAFVEGAIVRSCTVTSTGRVKSWLGVTLVTLKMVQKWRYDGNRVFIDSTTLHPDVSVAIYAYDGVVNSIDDWIANNGSPFWGHTTERMGRFTGTLGPFGDFGMNPRVVISVEADGNWSTLNDRGLPGCEDDD